MSDFHEPDHEETIKALFGEVYSLCAGYMSRVNAARVAYEATDLYAREVDDQ